MEKRAADLQSDRFSGFFDNEMWQCLTPRAQRLMARVLCIHRLSCVAEQVYSCDGPHNIFDRILQALGVSYEISADDFAKIPAEGPAVVVANHPFGGIEGVILSSLLASRSASFKVMVNHLLSLLNVPEFRERFIYVDPFGGSRAAKTNIRPVRDSIRWVQAGGILGIFPAGEVSHLHLSRREVTDPAWHEGAARIISKANAPVLPIFFSGCNSITFQLLGMFHPRFRTVMLPREMLNKKHKKIQVRVGRKVPFEQLRRFSDDKDLLAYLRVRTYMLGNRGDKGCKSVQETTRGQKKRHEPLVAPQPAHELAREVSALPSEQQLVTSGPFSVFIAHAWQVPSVLREIGRLRENTFRLVGEGTGKAIDLDRFDQHYLHLFLWNREAGEIAGGYRLGPTDSIVRRNNWADLYTSTLFHYQPEFFARIGPAIELGRSFVCPQYQKTFQPLLLLWKGIGQFIAAQPHYRMLFGPVSISQNYDSLSRQLIVDFSRKTSQRSELSPFVRGTNMSLKSQRQNRNLQVASRMVQNMQELSNFIADIEPDAKGIPILLKHYLKLGGEFLAFSLDPNFSGVMDVLILVDLARANPGSLERYMGKEKAAQFLRHQQGHALAGCA